MYEYEWSVAVYDRFFHAHILSSTLCQEVYRVRRSSLIKLIQEGSERWRGWKALVKHVEKDIGLYAKSYAKVREDVERKYPTFVKWLAQNLSRREFPSRLDLLDSEVIGDILTEPGKTRGGSLGASPGTRHIRSYVRQRRRKTADYALQTRRRVHRRAH
jgi:hypothetical protein